MGEAVKTYGEAGGDSVTSLQQAAESSPAGVARAGTEGVETAASVEEWYKDSCAARRSTLVSADGLKLACYHWDPEQQQGQKLRGKVVLIHGYAVHTRFEYLRHDLEEPQARPQYAKSWIQRLASAGFSVHAFDQQSFGASEGLKGKRAHFQDFDALPRDIIQFLYEQVLPAHDPAAPIFLCGISMGGCAVARAVELLAGGHYRNKCCCQTNKCTCETLMMLRKETKNENANSEGGGVAAEGIHEESKEEQKKAQPEQIKKVLLPLRGLICLAPMFALDRMKKKNRLVLPFAKLLATFSPTLEIAKAAKNPVYPAFDILMKNDPLAYNGKSRARLSYELLYAVSAVQQQAHYLAAPDTAALSPHSPLPFPVYIDAAPALLIVESKNDTFVDPEGSVYVAAVVGAKMEGREETLASYKPYYDSVRTSTQSKGSHDATLWMLDNLWHCFTKELPESDEVLDRIINNWLLPHAAAVASNVAQPLHQLNDKREAADASSVPAVCEDAAKLSVTMAEAAPPETAKTGGEGTAQGSSRAEKHRKHKKEKTGSTAGGDTGEADAEAAGAANEHETQLPMNRAGSSANDHHERTDTAVKEQGEAREDHLQPAEQETRTGAGAAAATEAATVEGKMGAQADESAASLNAAAAEALDVAACQDK